MRLTKILSTVGFVIAASSSMLAHADTPVTCNWGYLGGASYPGGWTRVDGCFTPSAPQLGPIAQRTRTNTGSCSMSVSSPYVNKGSCTYPAIYKTTSVSSPVSSTPKPVCTTTNINIGQTCNGENWCMESFGRACHSAGGKTVWAGYTYVCQKTTCTTL